MLEYCAKFTAPALSFFALCVWQLIFSGTAASPIGEELKRRLHAASHRTASGTLIPLNAQVIHSYANIPLAEVVPPEEYNGTTIYVPPNATLASLQARPFHIYDDAFLNLTGSAPQLTLIAESQSNPLFFEAVVWNEATDEAFFCQASGSEDAGTGLRTSAIIEKTDLQEARGVAESNDGTRRVTVHTVPTEPQVLNPNGATVYGDNIIFAGNGMGRTTSALYLVNPRPPYNTSVLADNIYGRQFNSLDDIAVHPTNKDIYFTDTSYASLSGFRPQPALRNMIYRLSPHTDAVTVVADDFVMPNGITFSPDGKYVYVTDSGLALGTNRYDFANPSSISRFDVAHDGTWENRKLFAFVSPGIPDGIHLDSNGNVYAGCGDGVHVWNSSGTLLGKIFVGGTVASFNFMGHGRMIIAAGTRLYYVTLAAEGQPNISP